MKKVIRPSFRIHKGKAALSLDYMPPKINDSDKNYTTVDQGVVFIKLANSIGQDNNKYNQYDWKNAKIFALSLVDVGKLIAGPNDVSLFHNPLINSDNNDRSKEKILSLRNNPDFDSSKNNSTACFLSISYTAEPKDQKITIALTLDELYIIESLLKGLMLDMSGINFKL